MLSSQPASSTDKFFDTQAAVWPERYQSRTYRKRRQLINQIIRDEVLRLSRPAATIRLLDFGCGSGVPLRDAAHLGLQVTGVDDSHSMIDVAHEELSDYGKQVTLEWLQTSWGKGDYQREAYDIVLCLSVLEFVSDISSLLCRLSARVHAGGILVVSVPNRQSWLRAIEKFVYLHPGPFRRFPALDHLTGPDSYLNYQTHQLTRDELSAMIQRHGLTEESYQFHVAPTLLGGVESMDRIGMMLTMTFRKPQNATDGFADSPLHRANLSKGLPQCT